MTIETSLLDPDEKLIWSGKPNALRYALGTGLYSFAFGFLLFAGTLTTLSMYAPLRNVGLAAAIPFLTISIVLLLTPFWMFYRSVHTTYLVTDKRAIVDTRGVRPYRRSFSLALIDKVDARPSSDDHGSIIFREIVHIDSESGAKTVENEGFIAIPQLAHIVHILENAIGRARVLEGDMQGLA